MCYLIQVCLKSEVAAVRVQNEFTKWWISEVMELLLFRLYFTRIEYKLYNDHYLPDLWGSSITVALSLYLHIAFRFEVIVIAMLFLLT